MPRSRSFHDVLRERRSIRRFLPAPVPDEVIRAIVQDAQLAPSNCNTQPWQVHIVSGANRLPRRRNLSFAVLAERVGEGVNPDSAMIIRISRAL